jgi:quercetin dioxygenase-like cupin family protein
VAEAGSSVLIPGGTPHAVWALEASLAIDTFAPPRLDYLAADED